MGGNDFLPEEIREFPYPWCLTDAVEMREAVSSIALNDAFIDTSLDVLDRCLALLPGLKNVVAERNISDYADYWGIHCAGIDQDVPNLKNVERSIFEKTLDIWKTLPISVEELVEAWLCEVVSRIATVCGGWLSSFPQSEYIRRRPLRLKLLEIIQRHWSRLNETRRVRFSYSMHRTVGIDALPFLERILAIGESEGVKEAAAYSKEQLLKQQDNANEGRA